MNIIKSLIERVEEYRAINKQPCKNYATEEAADKAAAAEAANLGKRLDRDGKPARYVVFLVPAWGRWTAGIDMTEVMYRPTSIGGYIGTNGFFSY